MRHEIEECRSYLAFGVVIFGLIREVCGGGVERIAMWVFHDGYTEDQRSSRARLGHPPGVDNAEYFFRFMSKLSVERKI